jgi:hypothetical protein
MHLLILYDLITIQLRTNYTIHIHRVSAINGRNLFSRVNSVHCGARTFAASAYQSVNHWGGGEGEGLITG